MKAYTDHLKSKFKPTFFGLFEKQADSLIKNVYAYIYNKTVRNSPAITGCRGVTTGSNMPITIGMIKGEFNAYNNEVQKSVLDRVNEYVAEFESSKIFPPTGDEMQRLLEVRDYFRENIKSSDSNENRPT
ncbi:hypothetical protein Lnau_3081 [Legionella nautarum]|uniref:Uncharacterized protein n=1 Tax=Legionella nautarum TaxID=45070 RepID=A0A0W0WIL0_9GAMM|nr:hypothetical protein [Legionella nautarum]KTD32170.1 hypothetical protein Lnau_3081 [Legionella nautarum]